MAYRPTEAQLADAREFSAEVAEATAARARRALRRPLWERLDLHRRAKLLGQSITIAVLRARVWLRRRRRR